MNSVVNQTLLEISTSFGKMNKAHMWQGSPKVFQKVLVQSKSNDGDMLPGGNKNNSSIQLGIHNYKDVQ